MKIKYYIIIILVVLTWFFNLNYIDGKSIPSCTDQVETIKVKYEGNYSLLIQKIKTFLDQTDFCDEEICKGKCLQIIANRYQNLKIWDSAFIYTQRALKVRKEIGDKEGLIGSLFVLGDLYKDKFQIKLAQSVLDQIIIIQPFTQQSSFACIKSGDIQFEIDGDYEMTKYYYEQFYNSNLQLGDSIYIHYAQLLMVRADRALEQFDSTKCLEMIESALTYFKRINLENID